MKHFKNLLILLVCIMLNNKSYSQLNCVSKINLAQIQQNNPARYQRILALEQHTQNYINTVNNGSNSARLINPNSTIIIPVVVHVLHRGEAIGVGRNISDAQIQSQIAVLNEDFRRLNADRINTPNVFQPVAADPNFEFRLSCIDPNGNVTNGITRTVANRNTFFPLQNLNSDGSINEQNTGIKFNSTGGRDAWPTNSYLNIWVCEMGNGLIGYGQFPDEYTVKANTDGVVMQFNAFGRVGTLQAGLNQGRVCVHEIGHWLNLRHVWGDANCGDDLVGDTPPQQTFNAGCPIFPRTSGCVGNGTNGDMFMNYMDFTNNGCMNIYTRGQSLRMRAIFAQGGPRAGFIDNYFKINTPPLNICSSVNLTSRNPNCLPVTWTVLSGSATIASGQNTNSVNIQTTGNSGVFRIRASTPVYVDEIDVKFGIIPVSDISITIPFGVDPNNLQCQTIYTAYGYGGSQGQPTAFEWGINSEWPIVGGNTNQSVNFLGNDNNSANGYLTLKLQNACGWSNEQVLFMRVDCNNGYYRMSISPNPARGEIFVTLKEEKPTNLTKEKIDFVLYDFLTRNVVKRWTALNGQEQIKLNIIGIKTGQYVLESIKGKMKQTQQIIIN